VATCGGCGTAQLAELLQCRGIYFDFSMRRPQAIAYCREAVASFAVAIVDMRENTTPYHLAHGLLDYAEHNMHLGDADAAQTAIDEARDAVGRLHCQPLLDRAVDLPHAAPRIRAPMVTAPGPEESAAARDR
jgi:hypothetical protein